MKTETRRQTDTMIAIFRTSRGEANISACTVAFSTTKKLRHKLKNSRVNIGGGRILKVEGHSGGSNYFGAKRRKKIFGAPHFSVVPTQFLMELGAQPS